MRPAIREVELVDELMCPGFGGVAILGFRPQVGHHQSIPDRSHRIRAAYPPVVGDHEPIQLRAISTSERAIDRISKRALTV
jgi:hypothetical protein